MNAMPFGDQNSFGLRRADRLGGGALSWVIGTIAGVGCCWCGVHICEAIAMSICASSSIVWESSISSMIAGRGMLFLVRFCCVSSVDRVLVGSVVLLDGVTCVCTLCGSSCFATLCGG